MQLEFELAYSEAAVQPLRHENSLHVHIYIFCIVVLDFFYTLLNQTWIIFKEIYLPSRWDPDWFAYSQSEWTWE